MSDDEKDPAASNPPSGTPPAPSEQERLGSIPPEDTPPAAGPRPPDQPGVAASRDAAAAPSSPEGSPATPGGSPPRPTRPAAASPGGTAPAAAGGGGEAPPRPARAAAGPSPAELALRAEAPSIPLARLRDRFPEIAKTATFFAGVPIVDVPVGSIVDVCRFLKDDPQSDCKYLSNLHGTHNPDKAKPLEVVYNLYSITTTQWIELKVEVAEGEEVPTVCSVWKTANWHEREAFDLLGIRFAGHPGLTRILLPDDWVGHPLRKEYPLEGKEGDHKLYR